jgi:hypothetical protein
LIDGLDRHVSRGIHDGHDRAAVSAPLNPEITIGESDRPRVYDIVRRQLADLLEGDQSYYPWLYRQADQSESTTGQRTMSEDDRSRIERAASITGNLYGEPMSPDRIAENFALYGLRKRVAALEQFDSELAGEIDSSPHSLRRRVQLVDVRRRMGDLHEALRKAKR